MIDETTGREIVACRDGFERAVTAVFTDAVRHANHGDAGQSFIAGIIRGDITGRFEDGRRVSTSYVEAEVADDVFLTRSGSVYRVESWAKEA